MNEVDTFHQRYSMVESMILIININIYFIFFFIYFRYSIKSDIWAIGITMYEVIKKEMKNIFKSESYPKLEESEELYDKEMIKIINQMLNVYILFIYFFFFRQLIKDQKLKIFYKLIIYRKYL
jgi:serine/threonine protein kinase